MNHRKNYKNRQRSVFEQIPCVDRQTVADFDDLGIFTLDELADADPEAMFRNLQRIRGCELSRDVLAVFRCAVYCACEDYPEDEKLRWWHWRD